MNVRFDHARAQAKKKLNLHQHTHLSTFKHGPWACLLLLLLASSSLLLLLLLPTLPRRFWSYSPLSSYFSSSSLYSTCNTNTFPQGRVLRPPGSRVVVVADVHGDLERLTSTLLAVELIDQEHHWRSNNRDVLVLLGDLVDRGPDTKQVLESVMQWSREAKENGGQLVELLGNHEIMAMSGVTRFVGAKDFESFGGEVPRQQAFSSSTGKFGGWLRCLNVAVVVEQDLYVHAGLLPKWIEKQGGINALNAINEQGRRAMKNENYEDTLFKSDGPLWTRYLARGNNEKEVCAVLKQTLKALNVTRMVVGHTRQHVTIGIKCAGQLLLLDTGMSQAYDSNPAALIVRQTEDGGQSSEIVYPAVPQVREEKRIFLEDIEQVKVHHEELIEAHRVAQSDQSRREQIKRDFILHKKQKNLRHDGSQHRRRRRRRSR
jgi:hypothetical protein